MTWIGIVICLVHSAMFSGLTIGFFGLSRLRLEVQAAAQNADAKKILALRRDSHFLLATLLWGNVGVNVLLALLTESVMPGVGAFLFSTIGITCFGEITPQAYFSRNALKTGAILVPVVRFYQSLLSPIAKPTAWVLDKWLGKEDSVYFQEKEFEILIKQHMKSEHSDVDLTEAQGATNFLAMDDITIEEEGEVLDEASIIKLPVKGNLPKFPAFNEKSYDPFLQKVNQSGRGWVVIINEEDKPMMVLDADGFLRAAMYEKTKTNPYHYCHRPILVTRPEAKLGNIIRRFKVDAEHDEDDVIDDDLILYWGREKRIITGADILGRLLRGIVRRQYTDEEEN